METVVSGIRSTGNLHLGNYFGALRNFVKMQHTERCFFFIADYHSLTTHPDPNMLHVNVKNVLSEYLAAGLDPEAATIYVQSDVPEVAELSLLLSMHAYVGELERTASFKDKIRKRHSTTSRHARPGRQGSGATPRTDTPVCTPVQPALPGRIFPGMPALHVRRQPGKNPRTGRKRQNGQIGGQRYFPIRHGRGDS